MPLNRIFKNLSRKYSKKFCGRCCRESAYGRDSAWDTPPYTVYMYVQMHRSENFDWQNLKNVV